MPSDGETLFLRVSSSYFVPSYPHPSHLWHPLIAHWWTEHQMFDLQQDVAFFGQRLSLSSTLEVRDIKPLTEEEIREILAG